MTGRDDDPAMTELAAIAAALNADPLHACSTWEEDARRMAQLIGQLTRRGVLPAAPEFVPLDPGAACRNCGGGPVNGHKSWCGVAPGKMYAPKEETPT